MFYCCQQKSYVSPVKTAGKWLGWGDGFLLRSTPRTGGLVELLGVASGGVALDIFDLGGSEVGGIHEQKRCKRWGERDGWMFFFCWKVEGISFEGTFEKLLLIT